MENVSVLGAFNLKSAFFCWKNISWDLDLLTSWYKKVVAVFWNILGINDCISFYKQNEKGMLVLLLFLEYVPMNTLPN